MTPELSELLDRLESDQLDFKATGYRWNEEEGRNAFVKDVLCMANTPRENDSHIITGVKKFADGTYALLGVTEHPDDADLQGLFADRIYPQPTFRYEIVIHSSKQFGVFVIPRSGSVRVSRRGMSVRSDNGRFSSGGSLGTRLPRLRTWKPSIAGFAESRFLPV